MHFHYKGYTFQNRYINNEDKNRYIYDDNTGIKARHTYKKNSIGRSRGHGSKNKELRYLPTEFDKTVKIKTTFWKEKNPNGFSYLPGSQFRHAQSDSKLWS